MNWQAAAKTSAAGGVSRSVVWPLALAVVIRVGVWLTLPASRFASDEDSYFQVGITLVTTGQQDLFWPPFTGWLIALTAWALHTTALPWIRLAWIVMDLGCLLAVGTLARRVAPIVSHGDVAHAERFTTLAIVGYALYLPAISFSQFTTSETPALLQTLLILVLLTSADASWRAFFAAGLLAGTLVLTRPSLLPLLVFLPAAIIVRERTPVRLRQALLVGLVGCAVVGAVVVRNWWLVGDPTIARNSAYNLYMGNRDLYAEDLNLFSPLATTGQVEFRRQYWSGALEYPTRTQDELQREALAWIAAHPDVFARRALGRLARVFAPKTDVLELVGGESRAGIFSRSSLSLLAITNAQWVIVLFGGLVGLARLWQDASRYGVVFVSTVLGSLPLCLVAISKPRYAFVFEPLLLLGATAFLCAPRHSWSLLGRAGRWIVTLISLFWLWGWAAWFIFAISSRLALAPAP